MDSTTTLHGEVGRIGSPAHFPRLGIRGGLFGAFAGVASLTLLASVVAFMSYNRIAASLQHIETANIPAMTGALVLARDAAQLSASSAMMLAADDDASAVVAVAAIKERQAVTARAMDRLDKDSIGEDRLERLRRQAGSLETSTDKLVKSVDLRRRLSDRRKHIVSDALTAHRAFIEKLAPVLDGATFNLAMGLEQISEAHDLRAVAGSIQTLAKIESPALRYLSSLRSEANLVMGILTEVSLAPATEFLPPLRDQMIASSHRARTAINELGAIAAGNDLHDALESLLAYGVATGNVFDARQAELITMASGRQLVAENQALSSALTSAVNDSVAITQQQTTASSHASLDTIQESRITLIVLAIASLAAALWIGWVYVGNRILRRLSNLNEAILALASGDLETIIPHDHHDELSQTANAIEVFKVNAIRARKLEAEKERDRSDDLRRREASFKLLFKGNPIPMWVHDRESRRILAVNDAAAAHYGYGDAMFCQMTINDIGHDGSSRLRHDTACSITSNDQNGALQRHKKANGDQFDAAIYSRSLPYEGHNAALVAAIDVTDRLAAEARISFMAHHDSLTGLANRTLFQERVEDALARANRQGHKIAIHYIDLDRFKAINDTLGHATGDALLQSVAERLRSVIRQIDTVARLGGDEFAIVQDGIDRPEEAEELAGRLLTAMDMPYHLNGHEVVSGASVGIAIAPGDGLQPDSVLRSADLALYRAKADGRGVFRFFEPEMDARLRARHALELDLRAALSHKQFEVHYQPIVDLSTGTPCAFEALLRWRHPIRGLVSPADFIPLAEEIGAIVPIGEWVLRQACADATNWPAGIRVAVNLSSIQFGCPNLVQTVMLALMSSGLAANRLELEVTESVLLEKSDANISILYQLRDIGIRIAMDDFGTGYSSLSYLRSFPFDKIKIDRCFVNGIADSVDAAAIVRAVSGLAKDLRIATTAEGIESAAQLDKVLLEGCTEGQGYYFARPMPVADVAKFLRSPGQGAERAA